METQTLNSSRDKILKGPLVLLPKVFHDERGYFYESFNKKEINNLIGVNLNFFQDNHSNSLKGVLRGMHFQLEPSGQGKLIRTTSGSIFDVVVDIRKDSDTYKQWSGIYLTEEKN